MFKDVGSQTIKYERIRLHIYIHISSHKAIIFTYQATKRSYSHIKSQSNYIRTSSHKAIIFTNQATKRLYLQIKPQSIYIHISSSKAIIFIYQPTKRLSSHISRPRRLSWMRRPTGDQEVAGSTPAEVGNILSWKLIMKYFLRSFSPFR